MPCLCLPSNAVVTNLSFCYSSSSSPTTSRTAGSHQPSEKQANVFQPLGSNYRPVERPVERARVSKRYDITLVGGVPRSVLIRTRPVAPAKEHAVNKGDGLRVKHYLCSPYPDLFTLPLRKDSSFQSILQSPNISASYTLELDFWTKDIPSVFTPPSALKTHRPKHGLHTGRYSKFRSRPANSSRSLQTRRPLSKNGHPKRKQTVSSALPPPSYLFNKSVQQNASALDCHMRHDVQEPLKLTSTKLLAQPPTRTPLPNDVDHPGYIRLP